ncbi:MAG: DUF3873 domain-containing protein [Muribaculaceae bacterium]|nr:DUF3873 domain-containing protein [Muribaculaceae bacterium]
MRDNNRKTNLSGINWGDYFYVVAPILRECRQKRDDWLSKRNK